MTENIFNGKQLEVIATEAEAINDYSSVRFWVNGKEVNAENVKMVVYVEDEELEKFECEDCGCFFMVKDRDDFDCPNCSSDSNIQTLQVGDKTYFVKEYKAGEFGIYDENDKLRADCFESIEQAQEWLDTRCMYCEELNESKHFLCDSCSAGMCDECYETNEHAEHYNRPLEECEDTQIDLIKHVCQSDDPQYICETCMKKALSLTPDDFAKEANKILEGLNLRAVIIETSELYGENDDEIKEGDPFYMAEMYEGYLEDIKKEEEIENTRTGRYCSLESVSEELENFAQEQKLDFISKEMEKIVGTRWESKQQLKDYLSDKFKIDVSLSEVDESGLVGDYAFIGSLFQDYGYLDIYYLKIPHGEKTIYITEISASNE